jgi:hypothetical protein
MSILRSAAKRVFPRVAMRYALRQRLDAVVPRGLRDMNPESGTATWNGHEGIELRVDRQLELIERWRRDYRELFAALRADERINPIATGRDWIFNGWFQTPDAEIYAAVIADTRPTSIVEVGGGYSTLIARRALDMLDLHVPVVVVDPEPRTDVSTAADEVVRAPIEHADDSSLPLRDRPLLFIDSSHVVRANGDVVKLYTRVVPKLPVGSTVHAHDIYLPYDYPPRFQYRLYTEQYVLQALLSGAARYEVLLSAYLLAAAEPAAMENVFGNVRESTGNPRGLSFWFRVVS